MELLIGRQSALNFGLGARSSTKACTPGLGALMAATGSAADADTDPSAEAVFSMYREACLSPARPIQAWQELRPVARPAPGAGVQCILWGAEEGVIRKSRRDSAATALPPLESSDQGLPADPQQAGPAADGSRPIGPILTGTCVCTASEPPKLRTPSHHPFPGHAAAFFRGSNFEALRAGLCPRRTARRRPAERAPPGQSAPGHSRRQGAGPSRGHG